MELQTQDRRGLRSLTLFQGQTIMRNTLRRSPALQAAKQDPETLVERLRETITGDLPRLIDQYKAKTGLQHLGEQFQTEVIQATLGSVLLHWDIPKRKRFSVLSKEMARVEKEAFASAKQLRRLQIALDDVTPLYADNLIEGLKLPLTAEWDALKLSRMPSFIALRLENLSNRAAIHVQLFKRRDKGGVLSLIEFRALVLGLGHAFRRATGRAAKVTWNEHGRRYEGNFVELVEIVLPLARTCADGYGWRMVCPQTKRARGKYIYDLTRAGRRIPQTSYHVS